MSSTDVVRTWSLLTAPGTGLSDEIPIEVPEDALSLLIELRGGAADAVVTAGVLVDPAGREVVQVGWPTGSSLPICLSCPNRVAMERGRQGTLVPIAPSVTLSPGTWRYRAFAGEPTLPSTPLERELGARVVLRRARPVPESGTLRLGVHLAQDVGLSPGDPGLDAALEEVTAVLRQVGIAVDVVGVRSSSLLGAVEGEAGRLAAYETIDAFADALNVILAESVIGEDGTLLAGLSPVPGLLEGTAVVVEAGSSRLGRVVAHEAGHYLGLWHTREGGSSNIQDPLPDTPVLPGSDNLMTVDAAGDTLTDDQGTVVRSHPLVQSQCP